MTEHTKTDSDGNTISQTPEEQKKQAFAEADAAEAAESGDKEQSEQGKEFYTIQTASDKVFYLIIDRDGEEEMVYFLTEITENDLLNTTSDNSETLPKNSAALESAIPTTESALPNNNTDKESEPEEGYGVREYRRRKHGGNGTGGRSRRGSQPYCFLYHHRYPCHCLYRRSLLF